MTGELTPKRRGRATTLSALLLIINLVTLGSLACGTEPPGQLVFRANIGSLYVDPVGEVELVGVSLQPGERYEIYIMDESGSCRLRCHLSMKRHEVQGAEIITDSGSRLTNEMGSFELYGNSSGWFHLVARFTSPADPPGRLVLRFKDIVTIGVYRSRDEQWAIPLHFKSVLAADPDETFVEVRLASSSPK